jgi:hypothetical protein
MNESHRQSETEIHAASSHQEQLIQGRRRPAWRTFLGLSLLAIFAYNGSHISPAAFKGWPEITGTLLGLGFLLGAAIWLLAWPSDKAAAAAMTPEQRRERARKGAAASAKVRSRKAKQKNQSK